MPENAPPFERMRPDLRIVCAFLPLLAAAAVHEAAAAVHEAAVHEAAVHEAAVVAGTVGTEALAPPPAPSESCGLALVQGRRLCMEDRAGCFDLLPPAAASSGGVDSTAGLSWYAVHDGHGGSTSSDYLAAVFHQLLLAQLRRRGGERGRRGADAAEVDLGEAQVQLAMSRAAAEVRS